MKPEDVPAELVEKAARAMYASDPFLEHYGDDDGSMDPIAWDWLDNPDRQEMLTAARHALAAVLPEYGARVLEDALPVIEVSGLFAYAAVEEMAARLREGSQS